MSGLFVVFEGIDGSGKTTISSAVAKALRREGLRVEHVREGGKFASATTTQIRDFTRDARNLALDPVAELLMYAAREAQLLGEATRPALEKNDVVIADRYVYTAEVLACEGRGLDPARVQPIVQAAAQGIEPDLVILVDVDPQIAKARRKISKLLSPPDGKAPSRKGLAGAGLQHRLAAGYRARAERDPRRWVVVENEDASLDALVARVTSLIAAARRSGATPAIESARPHLPRRAPLPAAVTPEDARESLLAWIDRRAAREPALAAWFLGGLSGPGVDERRLRFVDAAPEVLLGGMRGLNDAVSWTLRDRLSNRHPQHVARSLVRLSSPRAEALRAVLAPLSPDGVARSLGGRSDDAAWALRDELFGAAPDAVVVSTAGVSSARADDLRIRWLEARGGEKALEHPLVAGLLCEAITGVRGDVADRWRDRSLAAAPPEAIASLRGIADDGSFALRLAFADRAPKPVMESLFGLDHPQAWELRERVFRRCKEAIDSVAGMDGERAWSLRERAAQIWPSTVVKTVLPLPGPRTRELTISILEAQPGNVSVWKHAAAIAAREIPCAAASA